MVIVEVDAELWLYRNFDSVIVTAYFPDIYVINTNLQKLVTLREQGSCIKGMKVEGK